VENRNNQNDDHSKKALDLFNKGKYAEALVYYRKALKLNERDDLIHNNIAVSYRQIKNYDKAFKHIERAIELNPYNHLYFSTKATILTKLGKYEQALLTIDKAIELKSDVDYFMNKISILRRLKNLKSALELIDKLLVQDKHNLSLIAFKAILLFENKEYEKAKIHFQKLLGSHSDAVATLYLAKIKSMN